MLTERGMVVSDKETAKSFLGKVNYYRLSGYWFRFQNKWLKTEVVLDNFSDDEKEAAGNRFVKKVSFQNIIDIYRFDGKLRSLCIDALEKIEINVGTILCNYMCEKYDDGYWYEKKNLFFPLPVKNGQRNVKWTWEILMESLKKVISNNKMTPCIKSFESKYSNTFPPYWILSQLVTFGLLSKIYETLPPADKKDIALKLGSNSNTLSKMLHALAYTRNLCAHYARLWDNQNSVTVPDIKFNRIEKNRKFNCCFHKAGNNRKFFPVFYAITFFLHELQPNSTWAVLVRNKIIEFSEKTKIDGDSLISFEEMGFPERWENLPLFQKMLNV